MQSIFKNLLPDEEFYQALPTWNGEGYSKSDTLREVKKLRKNYKEI